MDAEAGAVRHRPCGEWGGVMKHGECCYCQSCGKLHDECRNCRHVVERRLGLRLAGERLNNVAV